MKISANSLRRGMVIEHNNKLWMIMENELRSPGKGTAVAQVIMRDIVAGNKMDIRFATQDVVERIQIEEMEFQFLYASDNEYTFMNKESFEQITINKDLIGSSAAFLQDGMTVKAQMHEDRPLSVTLPETVTMEITESDPVVKGQTASSSYKPAKLENGVRILVPPHIGSGTRVIVRTSDATYVERAKD